MPKYRQCPHCGCGIKHNEFSCHKDFCGVTHNNVPINKQMESLNTKMRKFSFLTTAKKNTTSIVYIIMVCYIDFYL